MAIQVPQIDSRTYDELLADTLARIPVHTPEWTNFHHADPGVTLIELFAFLAESAAYRANLIPERNRRAFLELLGIPRAPGRPAQGIVTLSLPRGTEPVPVPTGIEVLAGRVPFRLQSGLVILPVETLAVAKRAVAASPELLAKHRRVYQLAGREQAVPQSLTLYETVPIGAEGSPTPLGETVDSCVWLALLVPAAIAKTTTAAEVRRAIAGRVLSVGVVAAPDGPGIADAPAASTPATGAPAPLVAELPRTGQVVLQGGRPHLEWALAPSLADRDLLADPGVLHVTLPPEAGLQTVLGADPLEAGVGELPPDLQDPALEGRVVTWLRLRAPAGASARIVWAGVNAALVEQRGRALAEPLPQGTGRPDQEVRLARVPVVPGSVRLRVREPEGEAEWTEIGDLFDAGGEVAAVQAAGPPGAETAAREPALEAPDRVFVLAAADGTLRFGDGRHGRRPPAGAAITADYDHTLGAAGNVPPGAITSAPALPAGIKVANPVRTWGGAEPESIADAERPAARYEQHRDRLVTPEDTEAIALRTPGVDVGRVEVLPCYDPQLGAMPAGDAAGCVTVMVVPRVDPRFPETPEPDQAFIDTVCRHLAPRRLVTTELFVRGPSYVGIWITVGYRPVAGRAPAEVERAIALQLRRVLAAVDPAVRFADHGQRNGWPLGVAVEQLALVAEVDRTDGVEYVTGLRMAIGAGGEITRVPLGGLELPRVLGVLCAAGDPPDLNAVRGSAPLSGPPPMPVPAMPEDC